MAFCTSSDSFLSFRSSCDRCHAQKLKCLLLDPPSEPMCCQRCSRAKVPCNFSRRTRSKRTTTKTDSEITEQKRGRVYGFSNQEVDMPWDTATQSTNFISHAGLSLMQDSQLAAEGCQETELADNNADQYLLQQSTLENLPPFAHDVGLFRQSNGELTQDFSQFYLSTVERNSAFEDDIAFGFNIAPQKQAIVTQILFNFPSELHQELEKLQDWSLQHEDIGTLDGYPIGSVLHMCQRLRSLGNVMQQIGSGDVSKPTESTPSPWPDTSAKLILLSCYNTLIHIYLVVMDSSETSLHLQPVPRTPMRALSMQLYPKMCLAELPQINTSRHRIHTAVCMLLDSLEEAEEALGVPAQVRCVSKFQSSERPNGSVIEREDSDRLGEWGLLGSVASMKESSLALTKKVIDVKELLRQHMNF
jgi:hypothetical protein